MSYYQIVTFKKPHICKTNSRICSTCLIEIALKINFFTGFPLSCPIFSLILPRVIFLLNREFLNLLRKFLVVFFRFRKHSSIYPAIHRVGIKSISRLVSLFMMTTRYFRIRVPFPSGLHGKISGTTWVSYQYKPQVAYRFYRWRLTESPGNPGYHGRLREVRVIRT